MNRAPYDMKELAQAYVPFQYFTKSFPPAEALMRGTLFPELYKPYDEKRGRKK